MQQKYKIGTKAMMFSRKEIQYGNRCTILTNQTHICLIKHNKAILELELVHVELILIQVLHRLYIDLHIYKSLLMFKSWSKLCSQYALFHKHMLLWLHAAYPSIFRFLHNIRLNSCNNPHLCNCYTMSGILKCRCCAKALHTRFTWLSHFTVLIASAV